MARRKGHPVVFVVCVWLSVAAVEAQAWPMLALFGGTAAWLLLR